MTLFRKTLTRIQFFFLGRLSLATENLFLLMEIKIDRIQK